MPTVGKIVWKIICRCKWHGNTPWLRRLEAARYQRGIGGVDPRHSELADQVFVSGFVHVFVHLGRIIGLDLEEPAVAKRIFVDLSGIVFEG